MAQYYKLVLQLLKLEFFKFKFRTLMRVGFLALLKLKRNFRLVLPAAGFIHTNTPSLPFAYTNELPDHNDYFCGSPD